MNFYKLVLILIFLLLIPQPIFSQTYEPEHKVTRNPVICVYEIFDPQLPEAEDHLVRLTEQSVKEWESKLVEYTNKPNAWKIHYNLISLKEQQESQDFDCDVEVFFEREPNDDELLTAGYTDLFLFGKSQIVIFYLELIWGSEHEEIIDGETYYVQDPLYFENSLDPFLDETITHELGHALGLEHYYPQETEFEYTLDGFLVSPSIMVEPDLVYSDEPVKYEITQKDIANLVYLYGEDGFLQTDLIADYLHYLIVAISVTIILTVIMIRKK